MSNIITFVKEANGNVTMTRNGLATIIPPSMVIAPAFGDDLDTIYIGSIGMNWTDITVPVAASRNAMIIVLGTDFFYGDLVVPVAETVPAKDAADNDFEKEVTGNKEDTAVTTVGVVASIIAYVKGLINRTQNISDVGITAVPVAQSLADILHKDGDCNYDKTTDSLEALSDLIGTPNNGDISTDLQDAVNSINYDKAAGKTQYFTKPITTATTNGTADVTIGTATDQPCQIKSIVLRQNGAKVAELTSLAIHGGASKGVTFIDAVSGLAANLAAEDNQVSWDGNVLLAATKTIVLTIVGSGISAAQNLTVGIEYFATVDGGYIA